MHTYKCMCIYIYIYTCIIICNNLETPIIISGHKYVITYTSLPLSLSLYIYACVCIYNVHTGIPIFKRHLHIHVRVWIHTYTEFYTCAKLRGDFLQIIWLVSGYRFCWCCATVYAICYAALYLAPLMVQLYAFCNTNLPGVLAEFDFTVGALCMCSLLCLIHLPHNWIMSSVNIVYVRWRMPEAQRQGQVTAKPLVLDLFSSCVVPCCILIPFGFAVALHSGTKTSPECAHRL